jgi:hypothetical protein
MLLFGAQKALVGALECVSNVLENHRASGRTMHVVLEFLGNIAVTDRSKVRT